MDILEGKKAYSVYHYLLISMSKESAMDRLDAWSDDMQEDITEIDWNEACLKAQTQTINTRFSNING